MSDTAVGLVVVVGLVLLLLVLGLVDLRRRGARRQVSGAALARARGDADRHLPPVRHDGQVF